MQESVTDSVHECCGQHLYRFRDHHSPDAGAQQAQSGPTTKVVVDGNLRCWNFVGPSGKIRLEVNADPLGSASITSILRLQSLANIDQFDVTFAIVPVCLWSIVEIDVGLVCACLPAIRPLMNRMSNRTSTQSRSWPSGPTPLSTQRGSSYVGVKASHVSSRMTRSDTVGFETLNGETELERFPLSRTRSFDRSNMYDA